MDTSCGDWAGNRSADSWFRYGFARAHCRQTDSNAHELAGGHHSGIDARTNRAPHESTDAHSHTARHQSTDAHLHTARHQSTDAHLHGKTAPHQKGIHANADGYAYADSHPDGDSFTDSHSLAQRSCPWDSPAMTPGKSASSFRLQAVKVITSCNWNPQISQEHTPVLRIRQ